MPLNNSRNGWTATAWRRGSNRRAGGGGAQRRMCARPCWPASSRCRRCCCCCCCCAPSQLQVRAGPLLGYGPAALSCKLLRHPAAGRHARVAHRPLKQPVGLAQPPAASWRNAPDTDSRRSTSSRRVAAHPPTHPPARLAAQPTTLTTTRPPRAGLPTSRGRGRSAALPPRAGATTTSATCWPTSRTVTWRAGRRMPLSHLAQVPLLVRPRSAVWALAAARRNLCPDTARQLQLFSTRARHPCVRRACQPRLSVDRPLQLRQPRGPAG